MKSFFSVFLILCFISGLMAGGCKREDKNKKYDVEIETAVAGLKLPQKLNDNSNLTECYYKKKTLTYRMEISKERLAKMKIAEKRAAIAETLRSGILPQILVQKLIKADASARYVYFNENDSVILIISPEDLKAEEQ